MIDVRHSEGITEFINNWLNSFVIKEDEFSFERFIRQTTITIALFNLACLIANSIAFALGEHCGMGRCLIRESHDLQYVGQHELRIKALKVIPIRHQ